MSAVRMMNNLLDVHNQRTGMTFASVTGVLMNLRVIGSLGTKQYSLNVHWAVRLVPYDIDYDTLKSLCHTTKTIGITHLEPFASYTE